MRQDQARPGNKRLLCGLDLEIEYLFRQERTLLYSVRHNCTPLAILVRSKDTALP